MPAKLAADRIVQLPPSALTADPNQPRSLFDDAGMKALQVSIKEGGIRVPILVRQDGKSIVIVDGERRWRAAKAAKLKSVPVLLAPTAKDLVGDQVVINQLRAQLTPTEEARVLRKMRAEQKMSVNDIIAWRAKRGMTAMTGAHINRAIELLDLPDYAQALIDDGTVSAEDARALLGAKNDGVALKHAVKQVKERADEMGGRADDEDIADALAEGYDKAGAVRIGETYGKTVTYFDHRKQCKGCEFYRPIGYYPYCVNPKLFAEHNKAAKDAGFGPGGAEPRKSSPSSPKAEQKQKEQRQEQREQSLERRQAAWFYAWLRSTLISDLRDRGIPQGMVLAYAAAKGICGSHEWDPFELLARYVTQDEQWKIVRTTLERLDEDLLSYLAHSLQINVGERLRMDEAFLKMLPRAQLEKLCETANLETKARKVGQMQQALLDPAALEFIGCPAVALKIYDTPLDRVAIVDGYDTDGESHDDERGGENGTDDDMDPDPEE